MNQTQTIVRSTSQHNTTQIVESFWGKRQGSELSEESSVILRYQSKYTHSVNPYTAVLRYTSCVDAYHAVLDYITRFYYSACILIL